MLNALKRLWKTLFSWWMAFARMLGHANTILLLTVMYVLVIGPSWAVMRVFRKDPLRRKLSAGGSSWIEKAPLAHTLDETRHQF
jgi:hypothetical protein